MVPNRGRGSIGIIGLGHVGLPTGLALSSKGFDVLGYDANPLLSRRIARGRSPYREEGLAALLSAEIRLGRFKVAKSLAEVAGSAEVIFLCVPTPSLPNGRIDLRILRAAAEQLGDALRGVADRRLVVVKSTVPPGTTEAIVGPLVRRHSRRRDRRLEFASNPEFLAEGTMVRGSLGPERVVIGASSRTAWSTLKRVFETFHAPIFRLTPSGAELVKYASNTLLALKVSFANEIARLADLIETDVDQVMAAVGRDPRLGTAFLRAGPGFGGSCFDKDLRALVEWGRQRGVSVRAAETALAINADQAVYAVGLVRRAAGPLHGRRIALLGLSFKAGTEDVRESRAFPIARGLVRAGAMVQAHDPVAGDGFRRAWIPSSRPGAGKLVVCRSVEDALHGVDAAVLQADWPLYSKWPPKWTRQMRSPRVVDLRRAIRPGVAKRAGLEVLALGSARSRNVRADRPTRRRVR